MAYLTLLELKSRSAFEPEEWDTFFASRDAKLGEAPGTLLTFTDWSKGVQSTIDDALRRRYAVPFAIIAPSTTPDPARVPETVKEWAIALFDEKMFRARRYPGADAPVDSDLVAEAQRARDAMKAAADADAAPHPELPLLADKPKTSGIAKGGPEVESFNTIQGWFDAQAAARDGGGW
jgi:hypothetical protein